MHTLNPFDSRSHNSKVTNFRIRRLKGVLHNVKHLLQGPDYSELRILADTCITQEIERTKRAYADYVRNQFGVNLEPLKTLETNDCLLDVDEDAWRRLLSKRGGCSCHLSPPCHNCTEPLTEEELNSVGYTYKS